MAPRIGFTLDVLRSLQPAACEWDARLVWKDGDSCNVGIVTRQKPGGSVEFTTGTENRYFIQLGAMPPREMRLLAAQLIEHADELERDNIVRREIVLP